MRQYEVGEPSCAVGREAGQGIDGLAGRFCRDRPLGVPVTGGASAPRHDPFRRAAVDLSPWRACGVAPTRAVSADGRQLLGGADSVALLAAGAGCVPSRYVDLIRATVATTPLPSRWPSSSARSRVRCRSRPFEPGSPARRAVRGAQRARIRRGGHPRRTPPMT
jgi:hypothetical protein